MSNKIVEEQSYTEQQVKEMERSIEQDKSELEEVQREKQELTDKIFNLKTKYESSKDNLNRWKQELKSIVEQKNSLQKGEVEAMKKLNSIKLDESVNRRLEQAINKHKKDYEEAEKVAGKCRDKIEELNQKIIDINKRILDKPKENLAKTDEEIKEISDQLTNLNVEIKSASRNLSTSEKKLESMKEDYEINDNKEKECKERLEQMDEEGKKLIEEHEVVKEEVDELDKQLKEKLKANKNAEKQTQDLEMKKIDLQHKLEKLNEKLNKDESEFRNYTRACEKLKLHQIDLNLYDKPTEPLKQYSAEELEEIDVQLIVEQMTDIEDELKKMTPNLNAIQSYIELV
jgi:chromosome segregation ATPase